MSFTKEQIQDTWSKAIKCNLEDPKFRMDALGAIIYEDAYGKTDSPFGWQIDHIFPESTLKKAGVPQFLIDHPNNLVPLHHANNNKKKDNYPVFEAEFVIGNLDKMRIYNIETQNEMRRLYGKYIPEMKSGSLNLKDNK